MRSLAISFIACLFFLAAFSPVFATTPPDWAHSSLTVSSAVPADGQTAATVTVTLADTSGNPVTGDTVTLKSPSDSTAVISPSSTTLDGTGKAVFTITSKSPGTYLLTVTDTTTNTPFNGLGTVYFNPVSGQYTCTNPVPGSTPQLVSAVATGSGQVILTWGKATDPVSNYAISFGTASGNYQYGNTNVGGRSTTTFTVSSLANNTTYYFAVKAVNGCMPGNNSNELSATIKKETTTPTPTLSPALSTASLSASPSPPISSVANQEKITPPDQIPNGVKVYAPSEQPTVIVKSANAAKIISLIIAIIILILLGVLIYWYLARKRKRQAEIFDKNNPLIPPEPQENLGEDVEENAVSTEKKEEN